MWQHQRLGLTYGKKCELNIIFATNPAASSARHINIYINKFNGKIMELQSMEPPQPASPMWAWHGQLL